MALETRRQALNDIRKMNSVLDEIEDRRRGDVQRIDEPYARAMFGSSAEVIGSLCRPFEDCEPGGEPAWIPPP